MLNTQWVLSEGFGYRWSSAIRYEDLLQRKTFTIKCPHSDENESAFRFHAHVQVDPNDITLRLVPSWFLLALTSLNGGQEEVSQDKPQASRADRIGKPTPSRRTVPYLRQEYRSAMEELSSSWRNHARSFSRACSPGPPKHNDSGHRYVKTLYLGNDTAHRGCKSTNPATLLSSIPMVIPTLG